MQLRRKVREVRAISSNASLEIEDLKQENLKLKEEKDKMKEKLGQK